MESAHLTLADGRCLLPCVVSHVSSSYVSTNNVKSRVFCEISRESVSVGETKRLRPESVFNRRSKSI